MAGDMLLGDIVLKSRGKRSMRYYRGEAIPSLLWAGDKFTI